MKNSKKKLNSLNQFSLNAKLHTIKGGRTHVVIEDEVILLAIVEDDIVF